jgi:hypothetical protein
LGENLRQEYEDRACMMILKHFPNVKFVGRLALDVIRDVLMNDQSMRAAEKIIFNSQLEDEETFDFSCLPGRWQRPSVKEPDALVDGKEKSVLRIIQKKPVRRRSRKTVRAVG